MYTYTRSYTLAIASSMFPQDFTDILGDHPGILDSGPKHNRCGPSKTGFVGLRSLLMICYCVSVFERFEH